MGTDCKTGKKAVLILIVIGIVLGLLPTIARTFSGNHVSKDVAWAICLTGIAIASAVWGFQQRKMRYVLIFLLAALFNIGMFVVVVLFLILGACIPSYMVGKWLAWGWRRRRIWIKIKPRAVVSLPIITILLWLFLVFFEKIQIVYFVALIVLSVVWGFRYPQWNKMPYIFVLLFPLFYDLITTQFGMMLWGIGFLIGIGMCVLSYTAGKGLARLCRKGTLVRKSV